MGLRMQPRNEQFFTLFSKAGSNVVECAAILMAFVAAPHERWAELAQRMHETEHAGDDTTKNGVVLVSRLARMARGESKRRTNRPRLSG